MNIEKLPNGNLLVPVHAEAEDGTIGDALEEISPSHPDFDAWVKYITGNPQEVQ